MLYCPCWNGAPSHEVASGYQMVTDLHLCALSLLDEAVSGPGEEAAARRRKPDRRSRPDGHRSVSWSDHYAVDPHLNVVAAVGADISTPGPGWVTST